MKTQFATGIVNHKDGFKAGEEVAKQALDQLETSHPHLIILFCSAGYDYSAVIKGVQHVLGTDIPLIGCTTAGQFTHQGLNKEGVACALIASDHYQFKTGVASHLKDQLISSIQDAVKHFPKEIDRYGHQSALLFIDGLAGKGEEAVLAASSVLGPQVKFAGAAAADNLGFKETMVFHQQQVLKDAASICLIESQSPVIISVNHGHYPLSPSLKVTKAKDNVLYELDGKPALDIWKEFLYDRLKQQNIDIEKLSLNDWSEILLRYQAGLMTGTQYKIRLPTSCNADGSLNFVCSIMEGSVIKIMDSEQQDQIQSARQTVEMALKAIPAGTEIIGALIFDCSCRTKILKEQLCQAIEASQQALGSLPFIGCETYGEIAMEQGQLSGFHNATTVMMLFPA